MKYYVYILKSLKDFNHYTGISSDPNKRLLQHNAGKTSSTKSRRPFILIYSEQWNSRVEARNREKYLKSYEGSREKKTILENIGV
jgi:putative endonuclease